jgi:non-lysosomal glucosylceramidase
MINSIIFNPKMTPHNFKSFFSGAEGWGNISQIRNNELQENIIEVKWGDLHLKKLKFELEK